MFLVISYAGCKLSEMFFLYCSTQTHVKDLSSHGSALLWSKMTRFYSKSRSEFNQQPVVHVFHQVVFSANKMCSAHPSFSSARHLSSLSCCRPLSYYSSEAGTGLF